MPLLDEIAAGIGSAIGLYFVYGRGASKGHDTHHTGKQARNEESVAPVPAPPSDDVAESLDKEAKAVVPIVAKAAEEPTSSEGPKDDTKVAPINDINVPKTAEAHEEEEAGFVKVDAEEVKEVVESVQQELKVDNPKIAKKAEESQ